MTDFTSLQGLIISHINGLEIGSQSVEFITDNGRRFLMWHDQCCCEEVLLEDVVGQVEDLIGHPILAANVRSMETSSPDPEMAGDHGWTFYTMSTIKGTVDLRWYGTSNGYYSIEVCFAEDLS